MVRCLIPFVKTKSKKHTFFFPPLCFSSFFLLLALLPLIFLVAACELIDLFKYRLLFFIAENQGRQLLFSRTFPHRAPNKLCTRKHRSYLCCNSSNLGMFRSIPTMNVRWGAVSERSYRMYYKNVEVSLSLKPFASLSASWQFLAATIAYREPFLTSFLCCRC